MTNERQLESRVGRLEGTIDQLEKRLESLQREVRAMKERESRNRREPSDWQEKMK